MTRIKLCGLSRREDIAAANRLSPDYVGFVFAPQSRRCVSPQQAAKLKALLRPDIQAVGVFVDEAPEQIAALLEQGIIDLAQLHGSETPAQVRKLKALTGKPVIQAFRIRTQADVTAAEASPADFILLDSGAGTGTAFDWRLLRTLHRPWFLAGGLEPENVGRAVREMRPWAVDVSSGIETGGVKDEIKMAAFVAAVRKEDQI